MNTAASREPRIQDAQVTESEIIARLVDGRVISVPLAWSWRLSDATPRQRANFRLIGTGQGIHWPDVDEDISVDGMLHGMPAHRPPPTMAAKRGGPHESPDRRASAFSRSTGRVAPRPEVVARAADAQRSAPGERRHPSRDGMKKAKHRKVASRRSDKNGLRPEYDFSRARPNKYAARYAKGSIVVTLDPDVAAVFPGAGKANDALRVLARVMRHHRVRRSTRRSA